MFRSVEWFNLQEAMRPGGSPAPTARPMRSFKRSGTLGSREQQTKAWLVDQQGFGLGKTELPHVLVLDSPFSVLGDHAGSRRVLCS